MKSYTTLCALGFVAASGAGVGSFSPEPMQCEGIMVGDECDCSCLYQNSRDNSGFTLDHEDEFDREDETEANADEQVADVQAGESESAMSKLAKEGRKSMNVARFTAGTVAAAVAYAMARNSANPKGSE